MIQLGPRQYVEGTFEIVDDDGNLAPTEDGKTTYVVLDLGAAEGTESLVLTAVTTGTNPFTVTVDYRGPGVASGHLEADADVGQGTELIKSATDDFTCTPAKASAVRGSFGPVQTRA